MDDNKDDVKHMIPEDDVINLHDLLAHSAPTRSPEEFERSTEDVELEADEKKVPVLGEEFISHHDVVASSSSKRHTEVKINEEGTYRYVVGRPNMSGPSTSSNYYGQIVNNVNTGQRIDPALRGNSHHTVSRCASSSSTAGRSQAPPTFYCTLCRSNIPSAIYQLVVPSDLVPKEALRQLLLTKYGSSVVDEALKGDHPVLICRRHVENETESASSTFFCTLCRSHIPSSVNQLIVTPGVKPNLRRILQNKFSACQVEEALKGEEQLLICRRHVEEEIDPADLRPSDFIGTSLYGKGSERRRRQKPFGKRLKWTVNRKAQLIREGFLKQTVIDRFIGETKSMDHSSVNITEGLLPGKVAVAREQSEEVTTRDFDLVALYGKGNKYRRSTNKKFGKRTKMTLKKKERLAGLGYLNEDARDRLDAEIVKDVAAEICKLVASSQDRVV